MQNQRYGERVLWASFCRTKVEVDNVASKLLARGYKVAALHGDVSQFQREKILKNFKRIERGIKGKLLCLNCFYNGIILTMNCFKLKILHNIIRK